MIEKMPEVAFMILKVAVVVTFLKVLAAKINILIQEKWAVIVAILASVGVWGYYISMSNTSIDLVAIGMLVEVIIGSTIGYKLLPNSVKDFDLKNLRGDVLNRK